MDIYNSYIKYTEIFIYVLQKILNKKILVICVSCNIYCHSSLLARYKSILSKDLLKNSHSTCRMFESFTKSYKTVLPLSINICAVLDVHLRNVRTRKKGAGATTHAMQYYYISTTCFTADTHADGKQQ